MPFQRWDAPYQWMYHQGTGADRSSVSHGFLSQALELGKKWEKYHI